MAVDAGGNIFVGGRFTSVDNVATNHIARFDVATETWSALEGNGLKEFGGPELTVEAMVISGNSLFVAGRFSQTSDGTITGLTNIARYDIAAKTWSPLAGNGLHYSLNNGRVKTLAISGNSLFAGGQFRTTADNVTTNLTNIARYDISNNSWSPLAGNGLGQGFSGLVNTLALSPSGIMYVGGEFSQTFTASVTNLNNIARYDIGTNSWTALAGNGLSNGFGGSVNAALISGSNLFVGGDFSQSHNGASLNLNNIARYDTSANTWNAFAGNGLNDHVEAIAVYGTQVFVGGSFSQSFNGTATGLNGVARSDLSGGSWAPLPGNGLGRNSFGSIQVAEVLNLTVLGSDLFVGGRFTQTFDNSTPNLHNIARFEILANDWALLGSSNGLGLDGSVNAIAIADNGDIYVGGDFTSTLNGAFTGLNRIARFNNSTNTWSSLGSAGLNGPVLALTISGNDLFAAGYFTETFDASVTNLNYVARYNIATGTWTQLSGNGLNYAGSALAISGDTLYVGGYFNMTADGATTNLNRIARYTISTGTWTAMPNNGLNNIVNGLAISGNKLFVGGNFTQTADGTVTNLNRMTRFDTIAGTWSALSNNGLDSFVNALIISGNDLFVRGEFTGTFDGVKSLNRLAYYNTVDNTWVEITGDSSLYAAALSGGAAKIRGNMMWVGGSFNGLKCGASRAFTRFYLQQWLLSPLTQVVGGTDWHSDMSWTTGVAPAANSDAAIPVSAGTVSITSADVTMNDLMVNGGTLTIGAGRTLTINGTLGLDGSAVITGEGTVIINNCKRDGIVGGDATSYIHARLVRCVNGSEAFNFPVGTANGYSPVTIKNVTGTGNISVRANQGSYVNPATGLPANRLARWWQIENPGGGVTNADIYFNYLESDIAGNEPGYRAYRISGGTASVISGTANTFSNIVTAPNVTGFSDWTLAEFAPSAANVSIGGRVLTANGNGINKAIVTLTEQNGNVRRAITNSFGYYRFDDVEVGQTCVFSVANKRYQFAEPTRVVSVTEDALDLDFMALP